MPYIYIYIYTLFRFTVGSDSLIPRQRVQLGNEARGVAPPQTLDKVPSTITYRQPGGGLTAISVTSF